MTKRHYRMPADVEVARIRAGADTQGQVIRAITGGGQ